MGCYIEGNTSFDLPSFCKSRKQKARREYRCGECGATISVGTEYERTFGKWDGEIDTVITCSACAEIRDAIMCSWEYGNVWEAILEADIDLGCLELMSESARNKVCEMIDRY